MYPPDWPKCPGCGEPALDGHITCGDVNCDEAGERDKQATIARVKERIMPLARDREHLLKVRAETPEATLTPEGLAARRKVDIHICPPRCDAGGPADQDGHDFSVPFEDEGDGASGARCSKCGLRNIDYDMMRLP